MSQPTAAQGHRHRRQHRLAKLTPIEFEMLPSEVAQTA
jgi:hypothetical protein